MNRLVKLGIYADKNLYYDIEKEAFYAIDAQLENTELAEKSEEELESMRITAPDEVKALELANASMIEYLEKKEYLWTSIKKINAKIKAREKEQKKNRKKTQAVGLLMLALLIFKRELLLLGNTINDKVMDGIETYQDTHQNDDEHLEKFVSSLANNETISPQVRLSIQTDLYLLVESDAYIPNGRFKDICKRLEKLNFSRIDEDNYRTMLPYLLFGESNSLTKCISAQLDDKANCQELSKENLLFGELVAGNHDDFLTDLFTHDSRYVIKKMAEYYHVDEKEIEELLELISRYSQSDYSIDSLAAKTTFHERLSNIIVDNTKRKTSITDYDHYILSSQIFDGEYTIYNNLFADYAVITVDDATYGSYDLYFDPESGLNLSYGVYYEKLVDLIKEKGNNLDYTDPDCRFLIYLINLAHIDCYDFNYDNFLECIKPEDLASKVLNNIFISNGGKVYMNGEFMFAYLSNKTMNLSEVIKEWQTPSTTFFSIALFQEFYKCLNIDIQEGNIPYEECRDKLAGILSAIEQKDQALYDILMKNINSDTSLINNIQLYPFRLEYNYEDIKKYSYEKKEKE